MFGGQESILSHSLLAHVLLNPFNKRSRDVFRNIVLLYFEPNFVLIHLNFIIGLLNIGRHWISGSGRSVEWEGLFVILDWALLIQIWMLKLRYLLNLRIVDQRAEGPRTLNIPSGGSDFEGIFVAVKTTNLDLCFRLYKSCFLFLYVGPTDLLRTAFLRHNVLRFLWWLCKIVWYFLWCFGPFVFFWSFRWAFFGIEAHALL